MVPVKPPAVAGVFYPSDPEELRRTVRGYLASAEGPVAGTRAIIAPHAGYLYSGPVAASAYARILCLRGKVRRVALLGPSHYLSFKGLATSGASAFATPLGEVPVDRAGVETALSLPEVRLVEAAFEEEHCLEVHLPFLLETLADFSLVPLLVAQAKPQEVADVIEALWDEETLVVVSSDLSHFHPADVARELDGATVRAIEAFRLEEIGPGQACGHMPIKGLLVAAHKRGMKARAVDVRHSGETAGPADSVVGYGAFLIA